MKMSNQPNLKCITFYYKGAPECDVYVSGSFNHWNGVVEKMSDSSGMGDYYITHMLPSGRYEYKFVVNGNYQEDPKCPLSVVNDFGTLNSVIDVE